MERYRVLIADDEYYIRQRIMKIFPWDSLPLELAGEAENGLQVLELMGHGVDIVVLDIRMPMMDGLECARQIHERFPATRIIILSGYDNFSYAQTALRYGVADYILKPVGKENLAEVMGRVVGMLERGRAQSEQLAELDSYRRHLLYEEMLFGKKRDLRIAQLGYGDVAYGIMAGFYLPDDCRDRWEGMLSGFRDRGLRFETVRETDNTVMAHFFLMGQGEGAVPLSVARAMVRECGAPVYCSWGQAFSLDEPWQPHYQEVLCALLNRYFTDLPDLGMVTPTIAPPPYDMMKIRQQLVYFVNTWNYQGYLDYLDRLLGQIAHSQDCQFLKQAMEEWCGALSLLGLGKYAAAPDGSAPAAALLDEECQLHSVRAYLASSGSQLMESKAAVPSDIAICQKVAAYVDGHYADVEFNVARVAEHLGMNGSYLGSIFKRVRQLSINQYITSVRMAAAVGLLRENQYQISEIAGLVGYSDVFYFSKRFKGVYGVSPKEYRGG